MAEGGWGGEKNCRVAERIWQGRGVGGGWLVALLGKRAAAGFGLVSARGEAREGKDSGGRQGAMESGQSRRGPCLISPLEPPLSSVAAPLH